MPHSVSVNRDELRGAIERVAQFSDERSRGIRVAAGAGELKVHSSVSETGESEESIAADYDGPRWRSGSTRSISWTSCAPSRPRRSRSCSRTHTAPASFAPGGEKADNYRYVIMPMRI